jgi:DNA-binding transcriptional LysR family regulator
VLGCPLLAPITSVASLADVPCIVLGAPPTRWQLETLEGPQAVVVQGRVRTNNILAIRDAALAGLGVAQVATWLVTRELRKKRLVRVLEGAVVPTVSVYGLFDRGSRGSQSLRAIVDFLATELPRSMSQRPD